MTVQADFAFAAGPRHPGARHCRAEQTAARSVSHPAAHPPTHTAVPAHRPRLSPREVEVLLAWFGTESKRQAAQMLFISVGTLNTHLTRVRAKYAKVGRAAPTKASLLVRALQDGLTRLEDW